jgi:3-hydroxybutyryl-CoA dehydrogenase
VRIGIIGSGSLARQIAQLFATFGREVLLVTRDVSRVDIARRAITEGFDQAEKRGLIERSEAERAQSHIHFSGRHSDLIDCELVVEAVPEDLDVKRLVLARAGESCTPETLLATTTSSFRVSDISIGVSVPERVLGLHFFKPATVMKLVEIIGGTRTKKENIARADIFCRDLQKIPVVCEDTPGFLVNGLLFAYLADALELLLDPLVDEVEVDRTIAAAFGYPCGPIELMKWIGWGMCGDIIHNLSKYGLISSAKWRRAFVCLEQAGDASRMHSADDYEATLIEAQCGARAIT